jgi:class 3 adenylate cyclase/tetratricopeptide (TPR) repeat protein
MGAVVSESVELATILLTDLVGSTRLATSVGPVRADELREEHFGLLRQAIASTGGQEVKNLGDGLMVAFGSASGAVSCAVAMQQLFERRYGQAEQGLHVRIGLGAGESTVKDGDYFGMPTVEAARLCAQAPADGILISALVKTLAGRCEGVEFVSAGLLELKGLPEPAEAFSVSWAPLGEEASVAGGWPLPAVLRSVPPVSYVGRVEERAAIEEAMVLARDGARQVVLLSGEPGIGKTRLSSYGAHRAHAEGFAVCWGACSEELAVPYEPWIEVCSQLVEHAPEDVLYRLVERHKGELGRLARNLERRVADLPAPQTSDPETERYLLFSAVAGLLEEVAQSVPVCLVLDDLHWADGQSVALLKHVVRTVEQGALQVIATYRDSDLGKDHPLTAVLADLRSVEGVQRLALHGLDADEVAQIMTVVAGYELDEDILQLAKEIAAETDGNPFFVGEILRGLWESGGLTFDEASGRWSVDRSAGVALPESVREVIERRVERLGEEALEVLRLAAVIGRSFDLELLESILDLDESLLLDHLEAAVAASLLAESSERVGQFRFAHALINQTLYEGLGATRRARMHQRVAQALEDLYGEDPGEHLAELALHWRLAAVSVDKAKAANYALRAGQRALQSLAPAEAVKLFTDAVELIGDVESTERCEALIGLGEAQLQSGEAAYRETLLEASRIASAIADAELAARAALANNRGGGASSTIGEIDTERLAAIERAIELDDSPNHARRARLLAIKALELTWDPDFDMRRSLAEEAISLARATEDTRTLAEVLGNVVETIRAPDTLAWRIGLVEELVGCAAEVGDPALQFSAHSFEFHICVERGDLERAKLALEQQRLLAHELDQPTFSWFSASRTAGWELMRGDLVAGERLFESAFQVGQEAGEPDAVLAYAAALQQARIYQGRAQEIITMMEQSVSAYPAIAAWRAGLASTLGHLDRGAEAAKILEQAASDRFEHIAPDTATLTALALYADAAVLTDSSGPASILYELIEPFADQVVWNGTIGYGHARMWLGLLAAVMGDHEQADQHLAFACNFQETNGLLLWAARAHLGWAEALTGRGDATQAREHAARALELSREHGFGAFEARAAALVEAQSTA